MKGPIRRDIRIIVSKTSSRQSSHCQSTSLHRQLCVRRMMSSSRIDCILLSLALFTMMHTRMLNEAYQG